MGSRPVLLDLCCGAGGASAGYAQVGFEVWGVDAAPQPHYPFFFYQGDALEVAMRLLHRNQVAAIHASPPCQRWSSMTRATGRPAGHPDLIEPIRRLCRASGLPYVIENVPGAPLLDAVTLCGSMFGIGGADGHLRRHRLFETSFPLTAPGPCRHWGRALGVYGGGGGPKDGRPDAARRRQLMGMPWATRDEIAEAIPPAYTRWVGAHLLTAI